MLEKLATHEVESVTMLFSLADKCARAAEGCAWQTPRAAARKRRIRTGVAGSHILVDQSLQQRHQLLRLRLGARMRLANARARKVAAEVHAQCIPPLATAPLTAARSKSSRTGQWAA